VYLSCVVLGVGVGLLEVGVLQGDSMMAFKFLSSLVYVHCNDSEILRVDIYTCVFAFHRTYTCIC